MIVYKHFRFRVHPNKPQLKRLRVWQDALRCLWNLAHEQRLMALAKCSDDKVHISFFDQAKELTELRSRFNWFEQLPRVACVRVLQLLDAAWQRYFAKKSGMPRWKKKTALLDVGVCALHSEAFRLVGTSLKFPKIGNMEAVVHRALEGRPKMCTLKPDRVGDWFVSIVCEIEVKDPTPRTAPVIALDRGVVNFVATSDGEVHPAPRHREALQARIARASREHARKRKGSKNREKARVRLAKIHRKVARQRAHYLHVLSARFAKSHGVVVLENLNVAGMMRGNCPRGIASAGWSRFAEMLRYKLEWSGGKLVEVPAHYSSQQCSSCDHVDPKSRVSQAEFHCVVCGHSEHADINAAKTLKKRRASAPGAAWGGYGARGRPTNQEIALPSAELSTAGPACAFSLDELERLV